jgi:hypothetical protein
MDPDKRAALRSPMEKGPPEETNLASTLKLCLRDLLQFQLAILTSGYFSSLLMNSTARTL